MQALIMIDLQNEFTSQGKRPVSAIQPALQAIAELIHTFRERKWPIAWIRHFNKPHEPAAFVPGTWGSEFIPGFGPIDSSSMEKEFHKDVYGAFTGTSIKQWLEEMNIKQLIITGFYTHGCVSTTAREGIMAGYEVFLHVDATGTCDLMYTCVGAMSAEEVKKSALLHLAGMGATIVSVV